MNGWSVNRKDVPEIIREFYNYRDEMTIQNNIILRGPTIVIP